MSGRWLLVVLALVDDLGVSRARIVLGVNVVGMGEETSVSVKLGLNVLIWDRDSVVFHRSREDGIPYINLVSIIPDKLTICTLEWTGIYASGSTRNRAGIYTEGDEMTLNYR